MSDSPGEAEALMDRGWELLRRNNPKEALKVGKRLEDMRYSGCFEIQAMALWALHRRGDAIAILEAAVATLPSLWMLWQLLGNYRSDEGEYERAFAAYEGALACDCDAVNVQCNYANALARAGRWADALDRLEQLSLAEVEETDAELAGYIVNLHEAVLLQLERDEESRAFVERHAAIVARTAVRRN